MSDPIRSISQNNFILADQKEVSHDNTLSGNGTEESPLGLNETVLSNGQSSSTSPITLSEAMSNFEYVEIYAVWNYNSTQQMTVYSKISGDSTVFSLCGFGCSDLAADTQDMFMLCSDFSVSGTTITVNKVLRQTNSGSLLSRTDGIVITKIVGINRIANN